MPNYEPFCMLYQRARKDLFAGGLSGKRPPHGESLKQQCTEHKEIARIMSNNDVGNDSRIAM
jgi:hypothetical protein